MIDIIDYCLLVETVSFPRNFPFSLDSQILADFLNLLLLLQFFLGIALPLLSS